MNTPTLGRTLLILASALITATVIAVIALTPSPGQHRQMQRDNAVLNDLEQLQQAIGRWHREHGQLPAALAPVAAQPGLSLQLAPADGGAAYSYQPIDEEQYRLCAVFLTDTADDRYGRRYPAARAHGAGQHCFIHRTSAD